MKEGIKDDQVESVFLIAIQKYLFCLPQSVTQIFGLPDTILIRPCQLILGPRDSSQNAHHNLGHISKFDPVAHDSKISFIRIRVIVIGDISAKILIVWKN